MSAPGVCWKTDQAGLDKMGGGGEETSPTSEPEVFRFQTLG